MPLLKEQQLGAARSPDLSLVRLWGLWDLRLGTQRGRPGVRACGGAVKSLRGSKYKELRLRRRLEPRVRCLLLRREAQRQEARR